MACAFLSLLSTKYYSRNDSLLLLILATPSVCTEENCIMYVEIQVLLIYLCMRKYAVFFIHPEEHTIQEKMS